MIISANFLITNNRAFTLLDAAKQKGLREDSELVSRDNKAWWLVFAVLTIYQWIMPTVLLPSKIHSCLQWLLSESSQYWHIYHSETSVHLDWSFQNVDLSRTTGGHDGVVCILLLVLKLEIVWIYFKWASCTGLDRHSARLLHHNTLRSQMFVLGSTQDHVSMIVNSFWSITRVHHNLMS